MMRASKLWGARFFIEPEEVFNAGVCDDDFESEEAKLQAAFI